MMPTSKIKMISKDPGTVLIQLINGEKYVEVITFIANNATSTLPSEGKKVKIKF